LSEGNGYVFPSIRSAVKPLSENAMNSALRRMGYASAEMCAHGFRTSASTVLNERGFDDDVIETALAHEDTRGQFLGDEGAHLGPQDLGLRRKLEDREAEPHWIIP
jgi:integrase